MPSLLTKTLGRLLHYMSTTPLLGGVLDPATASVIGLPRAGGRGFMMSLSAALAAPRWPSRVGWSVPHYPHSRPAKVGWLVPYFTHCAHLRVPT